MRMDVVIEKDIVAEENMDVIAQDMKSAIACWEEEMEKAEAEKTELLSIACYGLSETPSTNFHVIGMMLRTYHKFQMQHEYPKQIQILCDSDETARMYRQVYNFYIPATKADRMPDEGWD